MNPETEKPKFNGETLAAIRDDSTRKCLGLFVFIICSNH